MITSKLDYSVPKLKYKTKEFLFDESKNISTSFFMPSEGQLKFRVIQQHYTDCLSETDFFDRVIKHDGYIFLIDGAFNVRVYTTDYEFVKYVEFNEYGESVRVEPLTVNGARKYLIANEYEKRLYNDSLTSYQELDIPYGEYLQYGGRLFVGSGNRIQYSKAFDFTDFNVGSGFGGYISLEEKDGEFIKMFDINDKLYILCRNSILVFNGCGDQLEYSLKRLDVIGYDIIPRSVVQIGEKIFFAGKNRIYELSNNRLTFVPVNIPESGVSEGIDSGSVDGFYVVPIQTGYSNLGAFYDISNKKIHTANLAFPIAKSEGYSIDFENRLCQIGIYLQNPDSNKVNRLWTSLGSCKRKMISAIEVENTKTANLVVYGEDKTHTFPLKSGLNTIRCNVSTVNVGIGISGAQDDFSMKKIKMTYRILE